MPAKIKDKGLIPRQHKCGLLGLTWGTDVKCPRCEHINDGDDQCPLCNTYTTVVYPDGGWEKVA